MTVVNQFISLINSGPADMFARFETVHDQTMIRPEAKVGLALEYNDSMDLKVELTVNGITLNGSRLSTADVLAEPFSRTYPTEHSLSGAIQTLKQSIVVHNASKTDRLVILEPWYEEVPLSHNEYCILNITFENEISLEFEVLNERFVIYCPTGSIAYYEE